MPKRITKLTVFAASPSDVQPERDCLGRVVEELNRTVAGQSGLVVELERWETHVRPGIGTDAQAVINRQIDPPDAVVGIFWTRLGTPTPRGISGTAEEIEQAIARWLADDDVEVLVYFSQQPVAIHDLDPEQLGGVRAFKRNLQGRGVLTRDYATLTEFERLLREHLSAWLRAVADAREPQKPLGNWVPEVPRRPEAVASQLAEGSFTAEVDVRHNDQLMRLTAEIRAALLAEAFSTDAADAAVVALNELVANVRKHTVSDIARLELDLYREFSKGLSIDVYSAGDLFVVRRALLSNLTAITDHGDREHGLLVIARLTGNLHAAAKYIDEGLAGVGCYVHDPEPRYPQYLRGRPGLASICIESDAADRFWVDDHFRYGPETAMILKHAVERGSQDLIDAYFGGLLRGGRRLGIEYAGRTVVSTVFEEQVDESPPAFAHVRSRDPLRAAIEAAFPDQFESGDILMLSHDTAYARDLADWATLWGVTHYTSPESVPIASP